MLLFLFIFALQLQPALCVHRWTLDQKRCKALRIYPQMKAAIEEGFAWAKLAGDQMDKEPLAEKARWIFGTQTADLLRAQRNLQVIGSLKFDDRDPMSEEWKKERDAGDLEIFCGTYYIKEEGGKLIDTAHDGKVIPPTSLMAKLKKFESDPTKHKDGTVERIGGMTGSVVGLPSSITFPERLLEDTFNGDDEEMDAPIELVAKQGDALAKKAAASQSRWSFLSLIGWDDAAPQKLAPIDFAEGFHKFVIHEAAHSWAGGSYQDVPKGFAYGWHNIITHRDPSNADSMAFMGVLAHVTINLGGDVTKDGKIILAQKDGEGKAGKKDPTDITLAQRLFGRRVRV